jgi:hypothetical protein
VETPPAISQFAELAQSAELHVCVAPVLYSYRDGSNASAARLLVLALGIFVAIAR